MSLTTYSYTKPMNNINILVGQITQSSGMESNINYYNYDPSTTVATFSYTTALDANAKSNLDTAVSTFVDKSTLKTSDITAFKYIRVYKTSNQNLTTTINAVQEVLFQSASVIDRLYFQTSSNGKYIYIQKPGTYLFSAKVGAYSPTGTFVSNTVLQWSFANDDTKGDQLYISITNSATYTFHTNSNNMFDSTIVSCIYTVGGIGGSFIKLQCKVISGATLLTINSDVTSFAITSVPGTSFYEGNTSVSITPTTSFANVNLGNDRIIQYPFTHTTGTSSITVSQPGYLYIIAKSNFSKTTGMDSTFGVIAIAQNGTLLTGVNSYSPLLIAGSKQSVHYRGIIDVVAGDIISLQIKLDSGTGTILPSGETGIILVYLSSRILPDLCLAHFTNDIIQTTPVTSTPTDVIFSNTKEMLPSTAVSISVNSNEYAVNDSGIFILSSVVTLLNNSGISRLCSTYFVSSVDNGRTYYYIAGSASTKLIPGTGKTTITSCALTSLGQGNRIKLQIYSNGLSTDNIQIADNTGISFLSFNSLNSFPATSVIFGQYFNVITINDLLTINTVGYVEKCRLVTRYIPSGIYRISSYLNFSVIQSASMPSFNIQLLDVSSLTFISNAIYTKSITFSETFCSVDYVNLSEGIHSIIMQLSSPSAASIDTKYGMIEIWKVM